MSFQKDRRLSVSTKVPKNFARTPPPAFLFPDQRFQRPKPAKPAEPFGARSRRRRCLAPLIFRVKQFFLKNFSNTPETRRPRRRRPSKESQSPSQPNHPTFLKFQTPKLLEPQKTDKRSEEAPTPANQRFDRSAEPSRSNRQKQEAFQLPTPPKPRKLSLRSPVGQPVSERAASIRTAP